MEGEEEKKNKSEADEVNDLLQMMDEEEGFNPADLPVPEGVSDEVVRAVQGPEKDMSFHRYDYFANKINSMPPEPKITMGYDNLDYIMDGGGQRGELVVISALPKSGKTTFCQNMSYLQGLKGFSSLWFTLEMKWDEITRKFMMTDSDYLVNKVPGEFPIYYSMDNSAMNVEKVRERIIEAQKSFHVDVVYIDHLHYLVDLENSGKANTSFLMGGIVRRLCEIAGELKVLIVLICHVKMLDPSVAPSYNAIRDSSFIAQEADFVLMLWRERSDKKKDNEPMRLEDDFGEEEVFTGRSVVSMELCRRGNNKKFSFGFVDGMFYPWQEYLKMKSTQEFFDGKRRVFEAQNPYVVASASYQEKMKMEKRKREEAERAEQERIAREREEEMRLRQKPLI